MPLHIFVFATATPGSQPDVFRLRGKSLLELLPIALGMSELVDLVQGGWRSLPLGEASGLSRGISVR